MNRFYSNSHLIILPSHTVSVKKMTLTNETIQPRELSCFSLANRYIDAWNSLNDNALCALSVPVFKYHVKRFLMSHC